MKCYPLCDLGNKDTRPGFAIGIYDQPIQIDKKPPQYQFILHANIMPKQGVLVTILSPSEYLYSWAASNQGQEWLEFQYYNL